MTTQQQQDRGQRPPPIRASNRIFELVDRQTGRVIAQTADRAAALRLRRQDPSLMFRGRDITGPPGIGIPRAEDVMRSRRAQAELEAGQERSEAEQRQFEADIDAVRPFQDAEGRIDVVAALEGGVSQDVLNRLITPEGVARGETVRRALAEVAPFRDSEGRIDLVAALEGGVPQETLNLLFEQASAQLETARVAVGARTRLRDEGVLDIEGGADLLVIIERGLESTALEAGFTDDQIAAARQVVDARKELRQAGLLDDNNNADLVEIIGRGMEATAKQAGFSEDDLGSARQVVAARTTLREAGVLDENNRADLVGVISRGLEDAARQAGFSDEDLGQARGVHEARETLREAGILDDEGNARLDFVFERGLEGVALAAGFTPEQLATARVGFHARRSEVARIQDAVPQLPAHRRADIVSWANRVEGALVAAATSSRPASDIPVDEQVALAQRRIADTVQDQATFISTFRAGFQNDIDNAQQTIRVAQRRMARSPNEPGHRELLAQGQAALAEAQAAMSVFQREIEPLMRQELQAGAARALNVFRTAAGILVEAGPGIPTVAPAEGVDVTTRARVVNPETGETVATVQGAAAIAAAEAAGFTVKPFMPELEPGVAPVAPAGPRGIGPFEPEPEVAGVATTEQVLALEQLRARQMDARLRPPPGIGPVAESERLSAEQQLVEAGVIDSQGGIFVLDALEAGIPEETLLAAGLTQGQINTAKVAPTLAATPGEIPERPLAPGFPTAEPRLRPEPGETLPVPEDIEAIQARLNRGAFVGEQIRRISPLGIVGDVVPVSNPFEASLVRRAELVNAYVEAVQTGDLTPEEARGLIRDLPANVTPEDWAAARAGLGEFLSTRAAALPVAGLGFAATGTFLRWDQLSPGQRAVELGLLIPYALGVGSGARIASRQAGALAGREQAAFIGNALAEQEIAFARGLINRPVQTATEAVRLGIINPLEAGVHAVATQARLPNTRLPAIRLLGLEDNVTTMRIAARERFPGDIQSAPMPEGLWEQVKSKQVTPDAIQAAMDRTTLNIMRTGRSDRVPVLRVDGTPTDYAPVVRPSALHEAAERGFAFSGTPDGRIGMLPEGFTVNEGMLYFSVNPHSRFTAATATGRPIVWTPDELARFRELGLNDPIPTSYVFSGDDLLSQLEPSALLNGRQVPASTPGSRLKLHGGRAESEAVAPPGVKTGPAVQRFFLRDSAGNRVQVLVFGEPLTPAEVARLSIRAGYASFRNIVSPSVKWGYAGTDARLSRDAQRAGRTIRFSDDAQYLDDYARRSAQASRNLQQAGDTEGALDAAFEGAMARRALVETHPRGGSFGFIEGDFISTRERDGITTPVQDRLGMAIGIRDEEAPEGVSGTGIAPGIPLETADMDRSLDIGVLPGDIRPNRSRDMDVGILLSLADRAIEGQLSRAEVQQARDIIARLEAQPLSERQQQDVQRAADTIRATIEGGPAIPRAEGPRIPATGKPTRLPEAPGIPGIPRAPGAPRVPGVPAVPGIPRVPEIPRVPGVPAVPRTPTAEPPRIPGVPGRPGFPPGVPPRPPIRPPGLPLPGAEEEPPTEEEGRVPIPRIVGVHHGNWERIYDLATGQVTLVGDDPRIPNVPSRQSFTVLATGFRPVSVREFPMGKAFVAVSPQGVSFRGRKAKNPGGKAGKSRKEALNNDDLPRIVEFQAGDFHVTKDLQSGEEIVSPRKGKDGVLATDREFQGPSRRALGPRGSEFKPRKSGF